MLVKVGIEPSPEGRREAGDWQAPTMPAHYARHQLAARGAVAKLRYQAGPVGADAPFAAAAGSLRTTQGAKGGRRARV